MVENSANWLGHGEGDPPVLRWVFSTDAALAALCCARESGDVFAADDAGGLYRIDQSGKLVSVSRGFFGLQLLACDDVGGNIAAVVENLRLSFSTVDFQPEWTVELPEVATAIAVAPYGNHIAVALANGKNVVYDRDHQRVFHFASERPLLFLRFLATEPAVIGAAEYGFVARWDFTGEQVWQKSIRVNIGDVACTGDGTGVTIAAFNEGLKHLDAAGESAGAYLLEGTPQLASLSFDGQRLAAATLEGHLYWLDGEGNLVWGGALPEEPFQLVTNPLGDGLIAGFTSGRIMSLRWE